MISVNPLDGVILVDMVPMHVDLSGKEHANIRAVHIYDNYAEIEFLDGVTRNKRISKGGIFDRLKNKYTILYQNEKNKIKENTPPSQFHFKEGDKWVLDLRALQESIISFLKLSMNNYIFIVHKYPTPTQTTLQGVLMDSNASKEAQKASKEILDWIKTVVLPYYYKVKRQILESNNPKSISWDFIENCEELAPKWTLSQILSI